MPKKQPTRTPVFPVLLGGERGGEWTIEHLEGGGHTNPNDKHMAVDMSGNVCDNCGIDHARAIRNHELMHAKLSHAKPQARGRAKKIALWAIKMAEEARIWDSIRRLDKDIHDIPVGCTPDQEILGVANNFSEQLGYPPSPVLLGMAAATSMSPKYQDNTPGITNQAHNKAAEAFLKHQYEDRHEYVQAAVIQAYLGVYSQTQYLIRAHISGYQSNIWAGVRPAPWRNTLDLAEALESLIQPQSNILQEMIENAEKQAYDEAHPEEAKDNKEQEESKDDGWEEDKSVRTRHTYRDATNKWCDFVIRRPALTSRRFFRFRRRSVTDGDIPLRMHRWPTDKAIFTERRGFKRGTVLIDISGSMNLTTQMLQEIVDHIPLATIAVYSSNWNRHIPIEHESDPWLNYQGRLQIVAHKGRLLNDQALEDLLLESPGQNGIDGPALRWLAKQPKPRVWVSDGQVTGRGHSSVELLEECDNIRTQAQILRVNGKRSVMSSTIKRTVAQILDVLEHRVTVDINELGVVTSHGDTH